MSGGLSVRRLSAAHRPGVDVLHDVSLSAPRGRITALLGPNGAGKSTLLKTMVGLLPPRGEILLDGESLTTLAPAVRARHVAYVPQRTLLTARLQVRSVVGLGRFAHVGPLSRLSVVDQEAVEQAMQEADVAHLAERVFTELSGGEQQRVLLARALATGARTLLLDEPTSSLDVSHMLALHVVLRKLAERDWCILIVLHGLGEARLLADQGVLLQSGRVYAEGPIDAVIHPDPIRDVYGVELIEGGGLGFALPREPSS